MLLRKQLTGYVMVLVLAAPLLFSIVFLLKQRSVQMDMRDKLEKISLQTISVEANRIVWIKQDKEIMIDGKLFDIKSAEIKGNTIVFRGLFDKDEDAIKNKLTTLAGQNHKDSQSQKASLLLLLLSPLYNKEETTSFAFIKYSINKKFPSYTEGIPMAPMYTILRPPKA